MVLVLTLGEVQYVSAQVHYAVIDIGGLGEPGVFPNAINATGQVAGWCYTLPNASPNAFSYSGGTLCDLGTLGGNPQVQDSEGEGINDSGQIVGWSWSSNGTRAFSSSGGTMHDLGTLGGANAWAYGINNSGQITGFSDIANGNNPPQHAFLYTNGTMQDLGTLGTGTSSWAYAINNSGQIVGGSNYSSDSYDFHAFLYSNGAMQDLGTLGTDPDSWASGINDRGQVVGTSYFSGSSTTYTAFLYSNGTMQSLGTGSLSGANSINNSGQVVGYYCPTSGGQHGFVYSGGSATDLNSLINPALDLTVAQGMAINDQGWIVASGYLANDPYQYSHGYLLAPLSGSASQEGDANLDGRVDINDLTIVLTNFGRTAGMSWATGDFVGDGKVDINDLSIVLANFGWNVSTSAAGASAVPEPSGLALLGVIAGGLLGVGGRRWGHRAAGVNLNSRGPKAPSEAATGGTSESTWRVCLGLARLDANAADREPLAPGYTLRGRKYSNPKRKRGP
jgi:probable HAF family extracellular repeat protein